MQPRVVIPSALAVLVALGLTLLDGRGDDGVAAERERSTKAADAERAPTPLAPLVAVSASAGASGLAATAPDSARTSAVEGPAAGPAPPPGAVMGVVVDARGNPVAGIDVQLFAPVQLEQSRELELSPGDSEVDVWGTSTFSFVEDRAFGVQRTGPAGSFLFPDTDAAQGGKLHFAAERYLGGARTAEVDPEVEYQVLTLPDFEHQDSIWTIDIIDFERRPLVVEWCELEYRGGSGGASRPPLATERTVEVGRIVQRGLPPGRWTMHIRVDAALEGAASWEVTEPRQSSNTTVIFESFEDALITDVQPEADAEGRPWVDPGSGLLEWLPEDRLKVGEERMNLHFAQTFRVGFGPVRAAQLTLRLRSIAHMSSNDALYLEHVGARKFAYGMGLAKLMGGWNYGARGTLRLDLARLTTREGEPLDLRPYLEDGTLDLVIQDDTVIESASLRVIR